MWIIIKGDTLIQDRLQSATTDSNTAEMSSFQTLPRAFASTLLTQLLICEWAVENWDAYLVDIEARQHEKAKAVLSNNMDIRPQIVREARTNPLANPKRTGTELSAKSFISAITLKRTKTAEPHEKTRYEENEPDRSFSGLEAGPEQSTVPESNVTFSAEFDLRGQKEFSFCDLQELQSISDKINEAALVLGLDISVFSQLLHYYEATTDLEAFPRQIATDCKEQILAFSAQLNTHIHHLQNCMARFRTLGESVSNCTKLVRDPSSN